MAPSSDETSGIAAYSHQYGSTVDEADESAPLTARAHTAQSESVGTEGLVAESMHSTRRRYSLMQFAVVAGAAVVVAGTVAFSGTVQINSAAPSGALSLEKSVPHMAHKVIKSDESAMSESDDTASPQPASSMCGGKVACKTTDDGDDGDDGASSESNSAGSDDGSADNDSTDSDTDMIAMTNGMSAVKLLASYDTDEENLYIPSTDPNATRSTRALLTALVDVGNTDSIMFGHENTNIEGQFFWDEYGNQGHSDVTNATGGGFPGVTGYNAAQILTGQNWTVQVTEAYARGSVITFFWSADNPVTGGSSLSCAGHPMLNLQPGGTGNKNWTASLDILGAFFKSLKYQGDHIPIIFRIFHECTGSWYWWGEECSHAGEYIDGWTYTQEYLRDVVGVHNLLYIYAPSKPSETFVDSFDTWWPGDDKVDIIGFDRYSKQTLYPVNVLADCQNVSNLALSKGKVVALGETGIADGIQDVTNHSWWMHDFVHVFMNDPLCSKMSYALTFANESPDRYWVPLKGNPTHSSFVEFYQSDFSIFAGDNRWTTLMKQYGFGPHGGGSIDEESSSTPPADDDVTLIAMQPDDDVTVAENTESVDDDDDDDDATRPRGDDDDAASPSASPTAEPTAATVTTSSPTYEPTAATVTTSSPTAEPTATTVTISSPTYEPTYEPTAATVTTSSPTYSPTTEPTAATVTTSSPTAEPTATTVTISSPTYEPTYEPTAATVTTSSPTAEPTAATVTTSSPTAATVTTSSPSAEPTAGPTEKPTFVRSNVDDDVTLAVTALDDDATKAANAVGDDIFVLAENAADDDTTNPANGRTGKGGTSATPPSEESQNPTEDNRAPGVVEDSPATEDQAPGAGQGAH